VLTKVEQVAGTDSTVLILGETGTGKGLVAWAIHEHSQRYEKSMVKVNCAALPASLIESELFGREKGAYTGAVNKQLGRFEFAHESTIFLDEIGEVAPEIQAKLLGVLEDGRFERLGSAKTIEVDVRIIAATNRNLPKFVRQEKFREDLFFRLNVFPIVMPPLRERQEDIPLLAWHYISEFEEKMGKRIDAIPSTSLEGLKAYPWPGNVRELRNVIEHAMIITTGKTLKVKVPDFNQHVSSETDMSLKSVEKRHMKTVLERCNWRIRGKNGAADILDLKPSTLYYRMEKLGLKRPS
jgi:formate hydrogenlyase transcriptional activator